MADLIGYITPGNSEVAPNPRISNDLSAFEWVNQFDPTPYANEQPPVLMEFLQLTRPVVVPTRELPGWEAPTFKDDLYLRGIHLNPAIINLGNIATSHPVRVEIWNSDRDPVTITGVIYDPLQGIEIEGVELPMTLQPFQSVRITVRALPEGPAALDAFVDWYISTGQIARLRLIGTRSKPWLFEPAWGPTGSTYQVTYSFSTEVQKTRNGSERRIALRGSPRRSVRYTCHLARDKFREFKDLMRHWQHYPFMLPSVPHRVKTTSVLMPGGDTLTLESVPGWVVPGALVTLRFHGFDQVMTIREVDGNTVSFLSNSPVQFPAGTLMHHSLQGRVNPSLDVPRRTNAVATLNLVFNEDPVSQPPAVVPPPGQTFNGREVFLKKPNWAEEVSVNMAHEVEVVDYGRGPAAFFAPIEFGTERKRAVYLQRTPEDAQAVVDLFHRMRGQQGEFYMPTWENDIQPMLPSKPADRELWIKGTSFAEAYSNSTVYRALFVLLKSGELLFRNVSEITTVLVPGGVGSELVVDEPWGRDISPETVVMIGWMPAWRFASDQLTVEWLTDTIAQVQMTMMTVEDLPVEAT